MIGVDITSISRFKGKTDRFIEKILTEKEIREYKKTEHKEEFLAKRWAIKEAIFKADNSFYEFSKIEIEKKERIYTFKNFEISTSQENDTVIAFVIKKEIKDANNTEKNSS
ncbi:holo-ACP synthase [Mycoplasma procyoni]|uniref:holo-ACP synthase n=1 Tax=Mycoplasma procyoni TaxID=568784 RepID=UPI00197C35B6|nr:4'-phosphopantetheinyl transferase superfamily protein [Mycoplasma procyoni]MBN3534420.1 4'-phosphopantetheinyl transferase superfamily protein [Mycoplasma procyoni]